MISLVGFVWINLNNFQIFFLSQHDEHEGSKCVIAESKFEGFHHNYVRWPPGVQETSPCVRTALHFPSPNGCRSKH